MVYNTCQTYFLNQDTSCITYCRTEWVRPSVCYSLSYHLIWRSLTSGDQSVEAGQLARVGLLGREQRLQRALCRYRPALVCPVSTVS